MKTKEFQFDSGILQFSPKGAYYEGKEEQLQRMNEMWQGLLNYDRTLFSLISLLPGTGFSKGVMAHILLSNNNNQNEKQLMKLGLPFDYEKKVVLYNLNRMSTPRALKNLLMFAGYENRQKINNARTRKLILEYIFNRNDISLEKLTINYKSKLKILIKHALGKQTLYNILKGNINLYNKWIGRYHSSGYIVLSYIFDKQVPIVDEKEFKLIKQILELKNAAEKLQVDKFKRLMNGLPLLTVMGYRNTYKVPIDLSEIYNKTKQTKKQSIQLESAKKKAGAEVKVDYDNQDIYDLLKLLYHKAFINDESNVNEISNAINKQRSKVNKFDLGSTYVLLDASGSMQGSETRPLHPFLTSLSIINHLDNIQGFYIIGGQYKKLAGVDIIIPNGDTCLWKGLTTAVKNGAKKILILSDGYENTPKGMFNHIYKYLKKKYDLELIHINPVISSDAKHGTTRQLVEGIKPLPVQSYEYLETEIIFNQIIENKDYVKKLLANKYNKLIEEVK